MKCSILVSPLAKIETYTVCVNVCACLCEFPQWKERKAEPVKQEMFQHSAILYWNPDTRSMKNKWKNRCTHAWSLCRHLQSPEAGSNSVPLPPTSGWFSDISDIFYDSVCDDALTFLKVHSYTDFSETSCLYQLLPNLWQTSSFSCSATMRWVWKPISATTRKKMRKSLSWWGKNDNLKL